MPETATCTIHGVTGPARWEIYVAGDPYRANSHQFGELEALDFAREADRLYPPGVEIIIRKSVRHSLHGVGCDCTEWVTFDRKSRR